MSLQLHPVQERMMGLLGMRKCIMTQIYPRGIMTLSIGARLGQMALLLQQNFLVTKLTMQILSYVRVHLRETLQLAWRRILVWFKHFHVFRTEYPQGEVRR
uniref:Uncharacterized protein n=1 Tax=Opuntia streptacantha TaxID=393608 RepID=A0A7C9A852_OPUST